VRYFPSTKLSTSVTPYSLAINCQPCQDHPFHDIITALGGPMKNHSDITRLARITKSDESTAAIPVYLFEWASFGSRETFNVSKGKGAGNSLTSANNVSS